MRKRIGEKYVYEPGNAPDVERGDIEALMKDFPDFREEIQAFTENM
jgi:hypothetical protein